MAVYNLYVVCLRSIRPHGLNSRFPENPVMLPILSALFSIPSFYVITQMPNYAQAARFTLLAYVRTSLFTMTLLTRRI